MQTSSRMAGTILCESGAEMLAPHAFRMSGDWRDFSMAEADYPWPGFPALFAPKNESRGFGALTLAGWPCWFAVNCSVALRMPIGLIVGGDSDLMSAFRWAMQVAELVGRPINYTQARDRYMAKVFRLRAESAPEVPALQFALLLEAKLRGEPYAYQLALQIFDAYHHAEEVVAGSEWNQKDPEDWDEDDWKRNDTYSDSERETLLEWQSWASLAFHQVDMVLWTRPLLADGTSAFIRARQYLLEAISESTVEGPGKAPEPRLSCEGVTCETCFEEFWLELQADMTEAEQVDIARRRAEIGMKYGLRVYEF